MLTGNSAWFGGGAYSGTLKNCTLTGNSAGYSGGGTRSGTLNNCTLTGNSAYYYGGGAYSGTLNNCMLTGNSVNGSGGGADSGTLNNCTLTDNSANSYGGGAYSGTLNNCIVYYNTAPTGTNYYNSTFKYSCISPLPSGGTGNQTNAPLFVNTNGWSNLRLLSNSPCINAGSNAYVTDSADLDGRPRIVGSTVDMGAYEFSPGVNGAFIGWLQYYGLTTDGSADYTDSDQDGMSNWQEWVAGTVPTNAASSLCLGRPVWVPSGATLTWSSVTNRSYALEQATNLGAVPAFSLLRSNIAGLPGTTSFTDTNALGSAPRFYRVRVEN